MQLPHFREEFIKHLNNKKVRSLRQLAAKPSDEIRGIFKNVSTSTLFLLPKCALRKTIFKRWRLL